ncbi:hypothetical protein [Methanobacterium paludis]|uniref:Uncharacterized protein n=1 Tax=Methanobacterium paludis (strain DSM 25820 / JCM 18151 / SWAN1) TaxID=868131 RepID=F6D2V2_METPW|nr:hypothetical protein [Methanobacterium paludis]AEG18681.1 hypothetical protein MSWAN_1670 [Methanobacterium paludis]
MHSNEEYKSGMVINQGHEWAFTVHLKKYDKRINNLDVDGKEILICLLDKEFDPRLYEKISMNPVDYGDHLVVTVSGFTIEWGDIPTGFEIREKIHDYVGKVLDVLELNINFDNDSKLPATESK